MASIKQQLFRRIGAAKAVLENAAGTERHAAISVVQKNAILELMEDAIASDKFLSEDIADLTDRVLTLRFAAGDEEEILALLCKKSVPKRRKQQDYTPITSYFCDQRWSRYLDPERDLNNKADILIQTALEMDCINPTEPTYKRWASDTFCAHFDKHTCQGLSADSKYALMDYIKINFKRCAKMNKRPPAVYLTKLPQDPSHLQQVFPEMYEKLFKAGGEPVRCKLEETLVMQIDNSFTCRGGLRGSSKTQQLCVPDASAGMQAQLSNLMPVLMQGFAQMVQGGINFRDPRDSSGPSMNLRGGGRRSFRALEEDDLSAFRAGMPPRSRYPPLRLEDEEEETESPASRRERPARSRYPPLRLEDQEETLEDQEETESPASRRERQAAAGSSQREPVDTPSEGQAEEDEEDGVPHKTSSYIDQRQSRGNIVLDAILARDVESKKIAAAKAVIKRQEQKAAKLAEAMAAKAIAAKQQQLAPPAKQEPSQLPGAAAAKPGAPATKSKRGGVPVAPPASSEPARVKRPSLPIESGDAKRARKPSLSHEKSRSQFLGRSGFTGANPGNRKFKYEGDDDDVYESEAAAKKAAQAWLVRQKADAEREAALEIQDF